MAKSPLNSLSMSLCASLWAIVCLRRMLKAELVVSKKHLYAELAMPGLRWLGTGLLLQRPESNPRAVHIGFVVDKVAQEQVFSKYFSFILLICYHKCIIVTGIL